MRLKPGRSADWPMNTTGRKLLIRITDSSRTSRHVRFVPEAEVGPLFEKRKSLQPFRIKGASIGFSWETAKKEVRRIDGQDVVCIHEAHLYEASYLFGSGPGAVKESYITYKDIDFSKSLEGQCSNFAYEGAAIGVTRALEKLLANTKS